MALKKIWITWEHQVRNISMAQLLDCEYIELKSNKNRIARYASLGFKTVQIFLRKKPDIIFFQNPSVFLALICALYKKMSRGKIVVGDFHNAALEEGKLKGINSYISKTVDITLVSNNLLFDPVQRMGGKPFCFPDPIPAPPQVGQDKNDIRYFLFISSWADDEPINNVLDAFINSGLQGRVEMWVTGRMKEKRLNKNPDYYLQNGIRFLGYVSEQDYWKSLGGAVLNIDLTTRENCLVCGAYESIAVEAPVLLSDNQASKEYFSDYAIFTDNSVENLMEKYLFALDHEIQIKHSTNKAKAIYVQADQERKHAFEKLLNESYNGVIP